MDMMMFEDIQFREKQFGGWAARIPLKDGHAMSIIAGKHAYSSPREDLQNVKDYDLFEIAVFDNAGDFVTYRFATECTKDDGVKGWVPREEILEIIKNHG
jgi:hypothetical protein